MVIAIDNKWAKNNPKLVNNLKTALSEALANHVKNPARSIESLSGAGVSTAQLKEIELERATFEINNLIMTPFVKQNGINNVIMLLPRLTRYTELLNDKLEVKNKHTATDLLWLDR